MTKLYSYSYGYGSLVTFAENETEATEKFRNAVAGAEKGRRTIFHPEEVMEEGEVEYFEPVGYGLEEADRTDWIPATQ